MSWDAACPMDEIDCDITNENEAEGIELICGIDSPTLLIIHEH